MERFDNRVLLSRHNGIGDIVMTLPFLKHLYENGYYTGFETEYSNFEWINWLFPNIRLEQYNYDWKNDFRLNYPGYFYFLNFNKYEKPNEYGAEIIHYKPLALFNYQAMCALLITMKGLPAPTELSPSFCCEHKFNKTDEIIVFNKSNNTRRTFSNRILDFIKKLIPNATVNPTYGSKLELLTHIGNAKLVISPDSGPIHFAELTSTHWICLHTAMTHESRHDFYKYGESIQSTAPCSPCCVHRGCWDKKELECLDMFNLNQIEHVIKKYC